MASDRSVPAVAAAFASRTTVKQDLALAPRFDADGLIPCDTTDANTGEVLGYMNGEALQRTVATSEARYWSRRCLWRKGATGGLVQEIVETHRRPGRRLAARPGLRFGRQLPRRIPFLLLSVGRRPSRRTRPARVHEIPKILRFRDRLWRHAEPDPALRDGETPLMLPALARLLSRASRGARTCDAPDFS